MRLWHAVKWFLVAPVLCLLLGCKASAGGRVNSGGDVEGSARIEQEDDDAFEGFGEDSLEPPGAGSAALLRDVDAPNQVALLGARHDLFLVEKTESHRCRCLAIATGAPGDAAFSWQSIVPRIDTRSQLVVAFTSRGQSCDGEPEESRGAAYHGYEKRGSDVIVMLEAAEPGRPQVTGAILPRPDPGGQLLLRPISPRLPYGRSLDGDGDQCVVPIESTIAPSTAAIVEPSPEPSPLNEPFESLAGDPNHPADDGSELSRRRTGLYLGAFVGARYSILEVPDADVTVSGAGFDFDLLVGGSPTKNLAVGGILGATVTPNPDVELAGMTLQSDDGLTMSQARFGAFADYYFADDGNLHGLLELAYASQSFTGGGAQQTLDSGAGLQLGAGLGYDFWIAQRWSLGFVARFGYAWLDLDGNEATVLLPALVATIAFH